MNSHLRSLVALGLTLHAAHAAALPYSSLTVFGDSLSDVGNISAATFGLQPGSGYYQGRFSNGPVYAERLAPLLGLGPLTRSGAGGNDFAYGGAQTSGTGGLAGLFLNDLDEQVSDFLAHRTVDPTGLTIVFIGANDLLGGEQNAQAIANRAVGQAQRLVAAGVRNLLAINLPLLGLTPDYNTNPVSAAAITATTRATNAALAAGYASLAASQPGLRVLTADAEALLSRVVALPAAEAASVWGFTNRVDRGQNAADASGYLFWDGVHPTTRTHAALADAAARAVLPAGDFDRDGVVAPADYTAWEGAYGDVFAAAFAAGRPLLGDANGDGRVDAADYTLWRDGLGRATAAPEPCGAAALAALGALAPRRPRRRTEPAAGEKPRQPFATASIANSVLGSWS